jgi:Ca2+-binding RTX toxin-like protein
MKAIVGDGARSDDEDTNDGTDDDLFGNDGNDRIDGLAGSDVIGGLVAVFVLLACIVDCCLSLTLWRVVVCLGGDGDDYIVAGKGDDFVYAGDGIDFVGGGKGNDMIFGELLARAAGALNTTDMCVRVRL